jgi:hypothetical protein
MGHYLRVLSPSDDAVPYSTLSSELSARHPEAVLSMEAGADANWEQLLLSAAGTEIAVVERNLADSDLVDAEIEEFLDEIDDCQPKSAVEWLHEFLPAVRTIYAFQILSGVGSGDGWEILDTLKSSVWRHAAGIIQADNEGFTNEAGYHILWQFSDAVTGEWLMGVLEHGHWTAFKMDLGNRQHRRAFLQGKVPRGTQRVEKQS